MEEISRVQEKEILKGVCKKLQDSSSDLDCDIFIGYDGFVDTISHVVNLREDKDNYSRIANISDMAERISQASGLSCNIELVPKIEKLGGNAPIMANALLRLGHRINYAGALGKPKIHPVFDEFSSLCNEVISFANPGKTEALEFLDGKLLLGKTQMLDNINWQKLISTAGKNKIENILTKSQLLSFNNWTMLYGLDSILVGILDIISGFDKPPTIFIDLADPQKRTNKDILKVLKILSRYSKITTVILSMNEKESSIIAKTLKCTDTNLDIRALNIAQRTNIQHIVIHPVDKAFTTKGNKAFCINGAYTPTPLITTGAGDNFNAGYCNGYLRGLSPIECLTVGVYTSGFYVRNGYSPNTNELINFITEKENAL